MKKHFFFMAICIYAIAAKAQNVGVGTSNPLNKLHVAGGLRLDTLTGVNGSGIVTHNANGVIYGLKFSGNINDVLRGDGTFGSAGSGGSPANVWMLTGNSGTNPASNFIGTTDNQPLLFRVNNIRHGYLSNNIFLGSNAGLLNTGRANIAIGSGALQNNISSSDLVAIGDSALFNNIGSLQNTAVGSRTLYSNTSGISNSSFGFKSMESNTIGSDNSAFGTASLRNNLQGAENTAIGAGSLAINTNGNRNSALGAYALISNTTANDNTAIGHSALLSNEIGYENTAVGSGALYANKSSNNTATGFQALSSNTNAADNSAFGHQALKNNTSGSYNIGVGSFALLNNTTGGGNTGIGTFALHRNITGGNNTSIGYSTLIDNTFGFYNTAVGVSALQGNTSALENCAFGYKALISNNGGFADGNSAFGAYALSSNTIGKFNTAVGRSALSSNVTGEQNIAIGFNSGTTSSFNNTVSIGNNGWLNAASNQVFIGNASSVWIGGWKPWSVFSDARLKTDIKEDVHGLDFIMRLRPVSYNQEVEQMTKATGNKPTKDFPGKYDADKMRMTGFLAQEVEQAAMNVNYNFSGISKVKSVNELYSMSYESFVVPLVKAVQEQQAIIEKQQKQIDDLIKRLEALEKK
jgi:hypothetical protein